MITDKTRAGNALNAILSGISSGFSTGQMKLYSGTVPATLATSPGTLLADCDLLYTSGGAFQSADTSTSVVFATGNTFGGKFAETTIAASTGTATYFRVTDSAGAAVYQGTVGLTGSGADLIVNTTSIVAGGTVTVTSCVASITGIY